MNIRKTFKIEIEGDNANIVTVIYEDTVKPNIIIIYNDWSMKIDKDILESFIDASDKLPSVAFTLRYDVRCKHHREGEYTDSYISTNSAKVLWVQFHKISCMLRKDIILELFKLSNIKL